MSFFDKFPYTNFQEINLDWIMKEVSKVRDNRDASDASAAAALASEQAAKASETAAAASQQAAAESEQAAAGSEAASAEYLEQIGTHTAGAVADWLEENLQPTTPPVDESLTVAGAAADAKVTGDRISELDSALNYSQNIIGEYAGKTGFCGMEIINGVTKKPLLKLKLYRNVETRFTLTLNQAIGIDTYLYLEDKNGDNIYINPSVVVLADQTVKTFTFTPTQDYDEAVVKYTTGRSASIKSFVAIYDEYKIKTIENKLGELFNYPILDHIIVSSKTLERPKQMGEVLYECASISGETTASSYCGFTISIDKPIIGNLLRAEGARTGGTGNTIRISFFDESGSRIGSENWTNTNFIEKEVPAGTSIVNITFASNWGNTMEVGSTFTFADVKIYYADKHILSFIPDNINTIVVSGENGWATSNRIYKCDSIQAKTGNASFNGFTFIIKNPVINNILTAKGTKTGGTGSRNIRISFFDKNGTRIGSENWTSGDSISKVVPENAESANVTYAANWGDSMEVGSSFSFSDIQILYSELTESIIGTGQNEYYGEPIILKNSNRINKCTISVWKDFKSADISDLANYCLFANQSMAIYGGYVFLFQQNNGYGQAERPGVVLDYSTKEILSTFSIIPNQDQHANSAQFTDIYYDDTDEFPIMMLSRCGGTGIDECQLYRVTRSGNTFTFTLINKIYADYDTNGSSWCIDLNKNIIYNVSKTTERGTDELLIVAWNMPTKSDIISGTSITLQKANRVAQMYSAWLIYQGAYGDGNNLYLGISTTNQNIYVYDVFDGRVVSRIPLTSTREVEGVAIYNEKIYYVQKDDTDTTATNPLTIYEITINN